MLFLFEQRLIVKPGQAVVKRADSHLDTLLKHGLLKLVGAHDMQVDMHAREFCW